jgi:hypothetical protein
VLDLEAHVTEPIGLLRQGPAGDHPAGWPATVRLFAPPGAAAPPAQLTLFEAEDGWRYTLYTYTTCQDDATADVRGRPWGWHGFGLAWVGLVGGGNPQGLPTTWRLPRVG